MTRATISHSIDITEPRWMFMLEKKNRKERRIGKYDEKYLSGKRVRQFQTSSCKQESN